MRKFYVCSPLSAETEEGIRKNMENAAEYAERTAKMLCARAIAPHSFLPYYIDDNVPEERALGLKFGLDLLALCDGIIVCGDVISSGMQAEIAFAEANEIPIIRYSQNGPISIIEFPDGTSCMQLFVENQKEKMNA